MVMKIKRFLNYSIPRGIVYHKISSDIIALFMSFFARLDDRKTIKQFENKFAEHIGRKYAIAFPFARVAIYYALKIKNLPAGSEIIMPPITIKAILDVVIDLGLHPVFVDIDLDTLSFDAQKLDQAIGENTKAILITYLFGLVPDIENMLSLCKKHNLFVIEDFSQCLNGKYKNKKMGCFGDIGVYSASSIKTLDTYGGGLLVCDDDGMHQKLRYLQSTLEQPSRVYLIHKILTDLIRNIATSRIVFHFMVFPLIKIMSALKPDGAIKHTGGRDQKMIKTLPQAWFKQYTSYQAKLGLKLLDSVEESDRARINNVIYLKANISSLPFPRGKSAASNVYWQLVALFENPTKAQEFMRKMGVDTSTTSLEMISSLSDYSCQGDTPNANYLYSNGLFIPSFPGLSMTDLKHISNVVNAVLDK